MHVCIIDNTTGEVRHHEEWPEDRARGRSQMLVVHAELQARDFGEDLSVYMGEAWPPPGKVEEDGKLVAAPVPEAPGEE